MSLQIRVQMPQDREGCEILIVLEADADAEHEVLGVFKTAETIPYIKI